MAISLKRRNTYTGLYFPNARQISSSSFLFLRSMCAVLKLVRKIIKKNQKKRLKN